MKFKTLPAVLLAVFAASTLFLSLEKSSAASNGLELPRGYNAEIIFTEQRLFPFAVDFDNQNRMIIAESDLSDRSGAKSPTQEQILRLESDGQRTVLASTQNFDDQLELGAIAYHDNKIYVAHGKDISAIEQDGKVFRNLVTSLPGLDNYLVNAIIFRGTIMYFAVSATAKDRTASGFVFRANDDSSNLETYAQGFEIPNSIAIGPGSKLYATSQNQFYLLDSKKPKSIVKFGPGTKAAGFAFAPSNDWGKTADAFLINSVNSSFQRLDSG